MAGARFIEVDKRFDNVEALCDLTLEVRDGEFLVLLGPSGSGKSTALRLLAGLESQSSGHILIGDRIADSLAPRERDIAMVFQDYALYPQMDVFGNLAFGLRMRKVPRSEIRRRVQDAADLLGLSDLLKRRPRELSGGQRQRVALGRALVRQPQVFLMDEPLSNLDAALRTQTRGEVRRLQRELGTTTVYVTHDQVEAMTMGDRVAILNDGLLQQVGTPEDIYDRPANAFVAGFIGSPAMSFATFAVEAASAGSIQLRRHDLELTIDRPGIHGLLGAEVLVGIRPEQARVWREAEGLQGPFDGSVELVESLGRETFIGVSSQALSLTVHEPGRHDIELGDRMQFGIRSNEVYLFHPDTKELISHVEQVASSVDAGSVRGAVR